MMAAFINLKKASTYCGLGKWLDCLEHAFGTERSAGNLPGRTYSGVECEVW